MLNRHDMKGELTVEGLIQTINEIVKYGLQPNLVISDKEKMLEKNLLKLYLMSLDVEYEFDGTNYPEYNKPMALNINQIISSNFNNFGMFRVVFDVLDINDTQEYVLCDATCELGEIICDLLEIKWRIETNSLDDGLWYFSFIFASHTQRHILDLLTYLRERRS